MKINVHDAKEESGKAAAEQGAQLLREALKTGDATIIVATGSSQFEMLSALVEQPEIDWSRVTGFHLDEYLGIDDQHPASFRKYLKERFVDKVPLKKFHYVSGESDPEAECKRLNEIISDSQVDVAFIGIGENGHLAFNDPPADFETESPYLIVDLDQACREQQMGEGWFPDLDSVPARAISMSVKQILKSKHIVCTVPDERKSQAVQQSVEGDVSPSVPASILQTHPDVNLFLDQAAASRLADRNQ
ncbi:glucosamine-6-phosphate deaminase [Mariniblastus fucicola]|uniref:Glucosamine-6-phosphate deaminase 1 n=1 Tax=Mariniblastus fucicola TaxID=980251 RepID=A0A5B9PHE2_9BACT|nr:glucosamine-6-phosphate deaminase [Mariniblastus fucicola]QEG25029.1 Glucosamine-6-phosphate deaminase 1 [Mariniblastus fucicola]